MTKLNVMECRNPAGVARLEFDGEQGSTVSVNRNGDKAENQAIATRLAEC